MVLRVRRRREKCAGFSFNSWRREVVDERIGYLATGSVESRRLSLRGEREAKRWCENWEDVTSGLLARRVGYEGVLGRSKTSAGIGELKY